MGNKQDRPSKNPAPGSQAGSSHANIIEEPSSLNSPPPSLPQSSNINRGPSVSSSVVRSTNGNLLLPGSSHINNIRVEPSTLKRPAPPPPGLPQNSTIVSRDSLSSNSSIVRNTNQNVSLLNKTPAQSSLVQRNNDGTGVIPNSVMGFGAVISSGVHSGYQTSQLQQQQSGRAVQRTSNQSYHLCHHLINQNASFLLDTKAQSSLLVQRRNEGTTTTPQSMGSGGGRGSGAYSGIQPKHNQLQQSVRSVPRTLPANQSIYQQQDTGSGRGTFSDDQFNVQQQQSGRGRGSNSGNQSNHNQQQRRGRGRGVRSDGESNHQQQQRGRGRGFRSGNQTNRRQQQSSRGRGAQSGNQDRNNHQQKSGERQNQNSSSSHDQHQHQHETNGNAQRRQFQKYPLNFTTLKKLAEENTEPSELVKKFTDEECGLQTLLRENPSNWEFVELILVALGGFCQRGGNSQFSSAFPKMITILRDNQVFQNVFTVFLQIPHSRSANLGSKENRLVQLVESISYLATEMLTQIPALACDVLGENFFGDLVNLKTTPSIRGIDQTNVFDTLQEVTMRLKNAWEQNAQVKISKEKPKNSRAYRAQMMSSLKPTDDFRTLSVMPRPDDMYTDERPFLRPNIVKGIYPDVDTYLDVQFRLLREDFFQPLRNGLSEYRGLKEMKKKVHRIDNVRLYTDVQILELDLKAENTYTLKFNTKGTQKINWEGSKRLIFGSLLLLSTDDFKTFLLFTVVDRKPEQLQQGKFKAKYEGTEPLPPGIRKQLMVMAESSVYFEAYRCVLQALQKISPNHFPMKPYILGEDVEPYCPSYLDDFDRPVYDLTVVRTERVSESTDPIQPRLGHAQIQALSNVAILEDRRPEPDILNLDPSQTEALYAALTREFVVIQGPPGTGKTYLGLKIVQALLHNKKYWVGTLKPQPSPILVICYTNHALDQFLEGIMGFTDSIVRIGGQSKCEAMQQFALKEWRMKASQMRTRPAKFRHWLREARDKLDDLKSQLDKNRLLVKEIESKGIIHEDSLYSLKLITIEMFDKIRSMRAAASAKKFTIETDSALPYWLGLDSIKILNGVLSVFRKTTPTVAEEAKPTYVEDEPLEEDEWDKEDVDEIEGQRIVEEMMDLGLESEETRPVKKPSKSTNTSIRFAVKMHDLKEYCWGLAEGLDELKGIDLAKLNSQISEVEKRIELISELLVTSWPQMDEWRLASIKSDFTEYAIRWNDYLSWRSQAGEMIEEQVGGMEVEFRSQSEELKDVQTVETAEIIRGAAVVGITTSGAAKQKALLEHLKCKIVVVEEAAEVLEAHIITSLSSSCQHLILIGDHLQLRPSTTVFELARTYKLDVSLFERMIENDMMPCVLGVQHRMRPEVARLIVPAIYPELKNHQSVERYPNVPGMKHNVFFLTHSELEKGDKSDVESRSHLNPYEADIALALARHLLMQGIQASQITILTTYSGQLLHFRKIRRGHAALQGVRISVVDNFQGEENDIIILSLVRSNEDANIGFLKTENRICVALSRAKQGFFLIGNMENLAQSKLWNKINTVLARHGQLGTHLELRCGVHHYIELRVNKVVEFPPEGGCFTSCETAMPCGHICPRICHVADRDHVKHKCHEACQCLCGFGHPCSKKCYEDCHPCMTRVIKTLPCTHSQPVPCFKDPKEEYCTTQVIKKFPTCTHQIELHCGRDIAKEKCPEKCGMNLDCGHICNLNCHKRSSHEKIDCRQLCRRSPCPEKHPCPKECFQDCGDCQVDVVKKLPCGHNKKVKCYVLPKDAYCNVKVEKILNDCQHTAMFDCSASTAGYQCRQACQRPLCADGHPCKKLCWVQPCGPCRVQVDRVLGCGHPAKMECHRNPAAHRCKFPKSVVLPHCNHRVEIACGDKPEEAICPTPCDIRLDCGHQCTQQCHIKTDPTHANYRCTKVCGRNKINCKQDHKCGKKCYEECDPCKMNVNRTLPCGHSIFTECGLDDKNIFCKEMVKKTIVGCGHEVEVLCSIIPTRQDCQQPCKKRLSCGHPCGKNCSANCSAEDCVVLIETNTRSLCGHLVFKSCSEIRYRSGPATTEEERVQFLQACPRPCRSKLGCEHLCNGECGSCFNGRLHTACKEKCGRTLVCGHSCKVNCASSCPPCKEVCQYRCEHSRCNRKCCEPCENCIEPCGWRCTHFKCTKKCYEPCDRPRCDEPCQQRLRCGHPCVGLCGEKCPPLCRICNKDELTEFVLYGNEEDEDARFVYLEDCGHTIEVDGLDHWMQMAPDQESASEIQMKCCPRCKTLIRSCYRYGDVIKKNFIDIVRVKEMLLGSRLSAQAFIDKLNPKILKLNAVYAELKADFKHHPIVATLTRLMALQKKLEPTKIGKNKVKIPSFHVDERFLLEVQVDVLESLLDVLKNAPRSTAALNQAGYRPSIHVSMKADLLENIFDRAERLVLSLFNRDRFSTDEHQSFMEEIRRLDLVRALFLLRSAPNYHPTNSLTFAEDRQLEEKLLLNTKKMGLVDEARMKVFLEAMGRKLNTGLGISDKERQEIVKAIGLSQGHWYKCPNGHIYAIGECGGAMQQSICPECKVPIGGTNHALLGTNRVAGEMDGARFAAWSEQANNMGNFQLD